MLTDHQSPPTAVLEFEFVSSVYSRQLSAASMLQARWRAYTARKQYVEMCSAAMKIKNHFIGYLNRRFKLARRASLGNTLVAGTQGLASLRANTESFQRRKARRVGFMPTAKLEVPYIERVNVE